MYLCNVFINQTVGYGDLHISNETTHIFLGFYIIFSTILLSFAVQNYQMIKAEEKQLYAVNELHSKMRDVGFLSTLDIDGNGITEEQFVLAMLTHLGTVDFDKDVKPWTEVIYHCSLFVLMLLALVSLLLLLTLLLLLLLVIIIVVVVTVVVTVNVIIFFY